MGFGFRLEKNIYDDKKNIQRFCLIKLNNHISLSEFLNKFWINTYRNSLLEFNFILYLDFWNWLVFVYFVSWIYIRTKQMWRVRDCHWRKHIREKDTLWLRSTQFTVEFLTKYTVALPTRNQITLCFSTAKTNNNNNIQYVCVCNRMAFFFSSFDEYVLYITGLSYTKILIQSSIFRQNWVAVI